MKGGFKKWFSDFLEGSAIMRGLGKLSNWIYSKLGSGVYSFIFGSYDTVCETFDDSSIGSEQFAKRGRVSLFLSRRIESSFIINKISSLMLYLSRLSMRVIGVFLMSAGLFTLASQSIIYLLTQSKDIYGSCVVALLMMIVGAFLLVSNKAFCRAVFESKIFGGFAQKFCGFSERSFKTNADPTGKKNYAFIFGLVFGVLSAFVNPAALLTWIAWLIGAYMVILNSEFGYNLMIFLLPFIAVIQNSIVLLAAFTVFTFFSYVIKLIRGKKYFKVELLDVLVVCFMFVMMLGGIISYGGMQSATAALTFTSLMLGYFLTVGLVKSKESLVRTVNILGVSLFWVSLIVLYHNFAGNVPAEWIDKEMLEAVDKSVISIFESSNMLGGYLVLLLPMVAAMTYGNKQMFKKTGYFVCFAAGCVCLVYTWARGAWLGFLLSAVLLMLMWSRKTMGIIVIGIVALPFVVYFLPQGIVSRLVSISGFSEVYANYRFDIWRGSIDIASDYALTGIGVGEEAFERIYPYYSFSGIEAASHAHNLFLQLFIEVGIFGFIVFAALLICLLQNGFSLAKCGEEKEVRIIGCGALCGVIAALVLGMTDYIWNNYRVFFIFWIVVGIVSAARRIDYAFRNKNIAYSNSNDDFAELTM